MCHGRSLRREKACEQCGAIFLGYKPQRFCGKECAYKSHTTPNRICVVCGVEFAHKHTSGKTACCSRECGWKNNIGAIRDKSYGKFCFCEWRNCINCQKPFLAKNEAKTACCTIPKVKPTRKCKECGIEVGKFIDYCKVCCHLRKKARKKAGSRTAKAKRRAKKKAVVNASVSLRAIALAHGCKCHICGKKVNMRLKDGPMMPSMDHVVPLALGGWHDLLNLRVTHWQCNVIKSDKYSGQLMLTYGCN